MCEREICPGCLRDLPWHRHACARCARSLPLGTSSPRPLCGRCQRRPPAFDQAVAAFTYEPPVSHLLRELKFHGRLAHARLLGELMADRLTQRFGPQPQLLLPVPLHPARQRRRGFN